MGLVLLDTSIWVDLWRFGTLRKELMAVAESSDVLLHPWVRGELELGGMIRNAAMEAELDDLVPAAVISNAELLYFVRAHRLAGTGVGYVDAQLLASAVFDGADLMTGDKKLATAARKLKISIR